MTSSYKIRLCTTFEEFTACLEMQRDVWQFADLDITPLRSFVITRRSDMPGSAPSTRHRHSVSFSIGPCGSTFHSSKVFSMRAR